METVTNGMASVDVVSTSLVNNATGIMNQFFLRAMCLSQVFLDLRVTVINGIRFLLFISYVLHNQLI